VGKSSGTSVIALGVECVAGDTQMTFDGRVRNPVVSHCAVPCRPTAVAHEVTDQLVPVRSRLMPPNDQPGPFSLLACPDDVMVRGKAPGRWTPPRL